MPRSYGFNKIPGCGRPLRWQWLAAATSTAALVALAGCSSDGPGTDTAFATGSPSVTVSAPESDIPSTTEPDPSAEDGQSSAASTPGGSFFAVDGTVKLVTEEGYTMTMQLTWDGSEPRIDVGSNPPGKTNILISADPFTAHLTNTTVGGRALPVSALPDANLVVLYPAVSTVCTQKDADGNPDDTILTEPGGAYGGSIRTKQFCGVRLTTALGAPWVGGHLDVGSLPNGTLITYSYDDLGDAAGTQAAADQYAQPVDYGPSWKGVSEATSAALLDGLEHPIAFGIETYALKPQSTFCTYPNQVSSETEYIALLDSNVGTTVPGC